MPAAKVTWGDLVCGISVLAPKRTAGFEPATTMPNVRIAPAANILLVLTPKAAAERSEVQPCRWYNAFSCYVLTKYLIDL